jgi:hypothetical protein
MQPNQGYKNVSVSTETLDVDELVYNCFGFLRTLPVDPATAERIQAAEQRLAASLYLNDDFPKADKKMCFSLKPISCGYHHRG